MAMSATKYGSIEVEPHEPKLSKGSKFAPWTVFVSVFLMTLASAIAAAVVVANSRTKQVDPPTMDKWVLMQGDAIMRDTFLALAATVSSERAAAVGSEADPNPTVQETFDHQMRDAVLVCYKNELCYLHGGTCVHFQANCLEVATAKDTCEESALHADSIASCTMEDWTALVDLAHDPEVDFMVSFHWVVRAMSRQQPGMNDPTHLTKEPKFDHLDFFNATQRLTKGLPKYVIMNSCHDSFLPSGSYSWDKSSSDVLMGIYAEMVSNNLRIFRAAGYKGPIIFQSCTPLSCEFLESKFQANGPSGFNTSDEDSGESQYDCLGQNFQLRQVNKRLIKLFREQKHHVGDVRYVDAFSLMSVSPAETCDGVHPFCTSTRQRVSPNSKASPISPALGTLLSVDIQRSDAQPSKMAPALAKLTTDAANPQFFQAAPAMCPCTLDNYGSNKDGSVVDNFFV
mmetsp:Transcript_29413/g.56474  ORF Transcript_29413/g.56474 Transcript_29413/m.56474 type:complete len:455 (+) Transcript_29413:236-1600(+)|eukprot:CAMPEP_0114234842 /NCGR_PEP_ID=MMETSP0058-20121206/5924_1 /TAXON_ID=36894 /ORGANISM="Pyramimonas parkeae, CCMP726" /LENGTH=454 /DNA_ID=CAMNT_0001346547 /DNA_START=164 /DNA_END=1528 /DNA_ORIENTATION=+